MQEGDGDEDGPGQKGVDRDGDPHLLSPSFEIGGELALDFSPDGPGLLADEASEVTGVAVEGQDAHEPGDGGNVGELGPLPQSLGFAETLADPS